MNWLDFLGRQFSENTVHFFHDYLYLKIFYLLIQYMSSPQAIYSRVISRELPIILV